MKNLFFLLTFSLLFAACKKDDNPGGPSTPASYANIDFGTVTVGQMSTRTFTLKITQATGDVTVSATNGFLICTTSGEYAASLTIPAASSVNSLMTIKFEPTAPGVVNGTVSVSIAGGTTSTFNVTGTGALQQTYTTFSNKRLAFGGNYSQSAEQMFSLPTDLSLYEKIYMYVRLRCPAGGCNAWDVYAHIQVKDPETGNYFELGRYITPYGIDNQQAGRGFKIDVTDFKSLLKGNATLRAFIEVWGADGWLLSVDFDYIAGTPDYPYYAVSKVLQYNQHSLAGVIYGEDASAFDLTKTISLPANTQKASLRTIISGWGHATPNDAGGRPCAEWCFRTHNILINNSNTFSHYMGPLGCASNPVSPQAGNWQPDRAGWCPGMEVPVRTDELDASLAGQSFSFEYKLQPWTNNMQSTSDNPHAYYAISNYVVVKSNTPIDAPVVTD